MSDSKVRELSEEFRTVVGGRGGPIDSVIPPLAFVLAGRFLPLVPAAATAGGAAVLIALIRIAHGHRVVYAALGVAAVLVAASLSWVLGRAEAYFLPGIVNNAFTILLCVVSLIVRRPVVALTSHVARRWPLRWYWHPKVRPAYDEVTFAWAVFFGLRLVIQLLLFYRGSAGALAVVQVASGWPATVLLLAVSYLYGLRRLQTLEGPSVDEFKAGAAPPWTSQSRGF